MYTAIILFLLIALFIAIGSFIESYSNSFVARKLIYDHPLFLILEFFIFLSVYLSTLRRLPFKKKLSGFYILHLGILILLLGSSLTFISGFEGILVLYPQDSFKQNLELERSLITIKDHRKNKQAQYELPESVFKTKINESWNEFKVQEYYPFIQEEISWKKSFSTGGYFFIKNSFTEEKFYLSTDEKDFSSFINLGPLNIHLYPKELRNCLREKGHWILWDTRNKNCKSIDQMERTRQGKLFYHLEGLTFFPELAPYPLNKDMALASNSFILLLQKNFFKKEKTLLIFTDGFIGYLDDQWEEKLAREVVELPWMDLTFTILKLEENLVPEKKPQWLFPKGNKTYLQGVKLKYKEEEFYLTSQDKVQIDGFELYLEKKNFHLPFLIRLKKFHMDMNPGTNQAASYESFVEIYDEKKFFTEKISMNQPLKIKNLTLYQNSYFETPHGYASVLNVNYDPGRFLKYLGSFLLVFGTLLHYYLRNYFLKL